MKIEFPNLNAVVHLPELQLAGWDCRMAVFKPKNDQEFSRWLSEHPEGFVLNVRASADPRFMVLHRATCAMVGPRMGIAPGTLTQRETRKLCADEVSELQEWAKQHGRLSGSFSGRCERCNP
jgi:hypothetical protein